MSHSSESDPDAPEAISLEMAKKSSKAQDKLVQDRNAKSVRFPLSPMGTLFNTTDICVNFCRRVARLSKDKNRARDARLKAAKEATNPRSFEPDPSSEKKSGKTQKKRSMRKSVVLPEDDDNRIDVEPNGEEEEAEEEEEEEEEDDPTQKRIRTRMESAMHDAEGEGTTEESEGLLSDVDVEGLDGDFAFGEDDSIAYEDEELEEIPADDEEMKGPAEEDEDEDEDDEDEDEDEDEDDEEYGTGIGAPSGTPPAKKRKEGEKPLSPEHGVTSSGLDYLPDEFFTQAATAIITARVQKPADSKTKDGKRKKKRNRQKVKSKDLIIG